jgi:hypothetical protein
VIALTQRDSSSSAAAPLWASWTGILAILFGVLAAATHANEWMKHAVIEAATPEDRQLASPRCPEDELEEEGLSVEECEQMVARLQGYVRFSPPWFAPTLTAISAIGVLTAVFSIVVGIALVDARAWAPSIALPTFAALFVIDVAAFVAAVNAGPIIRSEYLWPTLTWATLHLVLLAAVLAGRHREQ